MNVGRTSFGFLKTDDIRRYLEKKEFKSKGRRWSVCSDDSDSSALSDTSLRSLPQYSSYRALSSKGSLTTMSHISSPTSSIQTPSRLKQPSSHVKSFHKDRAEVAHGENNVLCSHSVTAMSRENSFTRQPHKMSGIPTPSMSRENSFSKIAKLKREGSSHSMKGESTKTPLKDKKSELSSSEILKREKAPTRREPAPVRPRQGYASSTPTSQISGAPVAGFMIGDRVQIVGSQKKGVIQFIGETRFAKGSWAGIVLDEPVGKNDGSVGGVRYFQCGANCGVFVKVDKLSKDKSILDLALKSPTQTSSSLINAKKDLSPVSNDTPPLSQGEMDSYDLKVNDRVAVGESRVGVLRYIGNAGFAKGVWCGIELDEPIGKNDGAVAGTRYFECQPKHGLFSPVHKVKKIEDKSKLQEDRTGNAPSALPTQVSNELEDHKVHDVVQRKEKNLEVQQLGEVPDTAILGKSDTTDEKNRKIVDLQSILAKLEKEKAEAQQQAEDEKRKNEDLQFQLEELQLLATETKKVKEEPETPLVAVQEVADDMLRSKERELEEMKRQMENFQLNAQLHEDNVGKLELTLQDYQRRETSINANAEAEKARASELEEALHSKEKELEELSFLTKEEIFMKEEEIKRFTDELETQKKLADTMKLQKLAIEEEMETMKGLQLEDKQKLNDLQSTMNKRDADFLAAKKELSEIKQDNLTFSNKIKTLQSELDHAQLEKETMEREIKSSLQTSGDNSKQLEQLRHQLVQKSRELTDATAKVTELAQEKSMLEAHLEESKEKMGKYNDDLEQKTVDLGNYEKQIDMLQTELKDEKNKVSKMTVEQTRTEKITFERESRLSLLNEEVETLRKEKETADFNYDELATHHDLLKEEHNSLQQKLEASEAEVESVRKELNQLKVNLTEDTSKSEKLKKDMITIRSELVAAQDKLSIANGEFTAMELKYTSACTERDRLATELEKRTLEFEQIKKDTEFIIQEQTSLHERERVNREALDNDRLNLQNKVEQTLRQLQTREGELANAKSQIQDLERQLKQEKNRKPDSENHPTDDTSPRQNAIFDGVKLDGETNRDDEVNFLNSVIVELQKKNKDLESQIKLLETDDLLVMDPKDINTSDLNSSGLRPELRPRLFCDICDVFDEHDTEDCPQQSNEFENGSRHHGVRGEERPYCLICEVFGHDTSQCDDEEMF